MHKYIEVPLERKSSEAKRDEQINELKNSEKSKNNVTIINYLNTCTQDRFLAKLIDLSSPENNQDFFEFYSILIQIRRDDMEKIYEELICKLKYFKNIKNKIIIDYFEFFKAILKKESINNQIDISEFLTYPTRARLNGVNFFSLHEYIVKNSENNQDFFDFVVKQLFSENVIAELPSHFFQILFQSDSLLQSTKNAFFQNFFKYTETIELKNIFEIITNLVDSRKIEVARFILLNLDQPIKSEALISSYFQPLLDYCIEQKKLETAQMIVTILSPNREISKIENQKLSENYQKRWIPLYNITFGKDSIFLTPKSSPSTTKKRKVVSTDSFVTHSSANVSKKSCSQENKEVSSPSLGIQRKN